MTSNVNISDSGGPRKPISGLTTTLMRRPYFLSHGGLCNFELAKHLMMFLLLANLAGCGEESDYVPPPSVKAAPGTVAFMGDSITALWNLAQYDSAPTLNFGISGDNTEQMLARFHNQVIDSDPAVVVILGGINDFQERGQAGTNTNAIQSMASEASQAGIKVILCSILPTDYPNPNLNLSEIQAFNQELIGIAQLNGYLYADYYSVMVTDNGTTDDSLFKDHIHPNDLGYARMWAVIQPLIAQDLE